jgi:hypothetical protein
MHPTRIFKTAEELQKAFEAYKEHLEVEALKWVKVQYVGKEGERVEDKYKLPMTLEGFEIFCYNNYGMVKQYFDNKDGYYTDFVAICSYIRTEIRNNQITGGLLGVYNPSITQRLNGLTEKVQNEQNININKMPEWLKAPIENITE